mmetsp:Transcript_8735/g.26247  ORF Transcript_8735/g.26247 Transcript_8735/m.26247 type:complete len:263 (-) Transcript_8735:317-1105(-)
MGSMRAWFQPVTAISAYGKSLICFCALSRAPTPSHTFTGSKVSAELSSSVLGANSLRGSSSGRFHSSASTSAGSAHVQPCGYSDVNTSKRHPSSSMRSSAKLESNMAKSELSGKATSNATALLSCDFNAAALRASPHLMSLCDSSAHTCSNRVASFCSSSIWALPRYSFTARTPSRFRMTSGAEGASLSSTFSLSEERSRLQPRSAGNLVTFARNGGSTVIPNACGSTFRLSSSEPNASRSTSSPPFLLLSTSMRAAFALST